MKAVVMAGGEGTRLRPLTSNQPKPMVPIVGKPCMEHIIELLKQHGFEDVIVTVAFLPQAIRSLLRRRRDARRRHRVLGRGVAARHRRLGAARGRPARRHVPRHLRRRALRRRPDEARRVPPREGRVGHDRPEVGREPARVRDRRHRRGRPHRALPREAVVGPGLLRHDQHRHLRARAGGAAAHPDGPARSTSRRSSSRCCSRWAGRCTATSWTATGRTSATSTSSARRTSTRSTRRVRLQHPRHPHPRQRLGGGGRRPARPRRDRRPRVPRQLLPHRAATRPSARTRVLGVERDAARTRAHGALDHRRVDVDRPQSTSVEGAIVGRSCDLRAHVRVQEGVAIGDEVTIGSESVIMPGVRIYPYKEVETGSQLFESLIWESRGDDAHLPRATASPASSTSTSRPTSPCGSPPRSAPRSSAAPRRRVAARERRRAG